MFLAIDTASAACSAALISRDGTVLRAAREVVGRGHAERLVPMIEALLAEAGVGQPDSVLVDCGPGSFTGVRVGLAAAIGLGMGWGVPVQGCSSLPLIAMARFAADPMLETIALAISGGHGELFVQRFAAGPFGPLSDLVSLPPVMAAMQIPDETVAGSGAEALVSARGTGTALSVLPDAAETALLPASFRSLSPKPIYGRAPDAKPAAA